MQTFLRAQASPRPAPVQGGLEFRLWRPFFDLSALDGPAPALVLGIELAWHNLLTERDQVPVQTRPGEAFRRRVLELSGLPEYLLEDPAALPAALRSPRWRRLCELSAGYDRLAIGQQLAVTGVLASLGLYQYLASLPYPMDADPRALLLRARLEHARSVIARSRASLQGSLQALEAVAACAELEVGARLGAATTLVVLYSQSRLRQLDQVARTSRLAEDLAARLRPEDDWLDLFRLSTYWRAVSFEPFLAGDIEQTRQQLDNAEDCARRLPTETSTQRWLRAQNFHPLLETRIKEALWAGESELALRRAFELRDRDPLDGKVHLVLGDVHVKRQEPEAAARSYLAAAALGAPYRSLAWCKFAAVTADYADATYALMCAHRADPRALTPVVLLRDVAQRRGDARLVSWAAELSGELTAAAGAEESQCAPAS